ncbi:pectin lyase-like superfamily protein [Striga asiatica]|uniref:Pectin lyase-like superfamily protein n=1 Tax=Striga asiatica TaxID=4170 RepID=A0A5A7QU24_STRAF|nr:pectin lyase-like superfamily protein [Striga asiatica]
MLMLPLTMENKIISLLFSMLCMASLLVGAKLRTFNVMSFGAHGNGITDDAQAFLKAWRAACQSQALPNTVPVVIVPSKRTFLLNPLTFNGPCKSSQIYMLVSGKLIAPVKTAWKGTQKNAWIIFSNVNGLVVKGKGVIDGQGPSWWPSRPCFDDPAHGVDCKGPIGMMFRRCNGLRLDGFSKVNGPGRHILIMATNDAIVSNLRVIAPGDSPNTDAIDISSSTRVQIRNSFIATGDDCIAISAGSSNIDVSGITCGPGHGIRAVPIVYPPRTRLWEPVCSRAWYQSRFYLGPCDDVPIVYPPRIRAGLGTPSPVGLGLSKDLQVRGRVRIPLVTCELSYIVHIWKIDPPYKTNGLFLLPPIGFGMEPHLDFIWTFPFFHGVFHDSGIGSLGSGGFDVVENVRVRNCTLRNTLTGVRIKTNQGGKGYARKISFQGIKFVAVDNPIQIEQFYCPLKVNCQNYTSAVAISDVSFIGISGTSIASNVISLRCSQRVECTNIRLDRVYITPTTPANKVTATCNNAQGRATRGIESLGEHGQNDQIESVSVSVTNCTFNGTTNGVRIKTWQGGSGFARNINFTNIT